jgi:UDP-N-acetylglucosamine 1-carboxyvinyltransferase
MSTFEIIGGRSLNGELTPQGAKNEALQVISAVLLTKEPVTISNVPNILDVNKLIELLEGLGVYVTSKGKGIYTFQAKNINIEFLISEEYNKLGAALRGSIMVLGPLLSRFG